MMNWIDTKYYYLILMLLSISYPLIKSFENRLQFYKNWKSLFVAIISMMIVFISWDVIFTDLAIWSFNDQYILGHKFLYLPIEEWMFFVCVPYACVFIHEVLIFFFPLKTTNSKIRVWARLIAFILLFVGVFFWHKTYTCVCFILTGMFLLLIQRKNLLLLTLICRTYLVSLIPFFIINGILTGALTIEPIVMYNDQQNTSLRVFTIPIEDFIYCFLMLGLTIWIYEWKKQYKK